MTRRSSISTKKSTVSFCWSQGGRIACRMIRTPKGGTATVQKKMVFGIQAAVCGALVEHRIQHWVQFISIANSGHPSHELQALKSRLGDLERNRGTDNLAAVTVRNTRERERDLATLSRRDKQSVWGFRLPTDASVPWFALCFCASVLLESLTDATIYALRMEVFANFWTCFADASPICLVPQSVY